MLLHWFERKGLSTRLALLLTLLVFFAIIAVFMVTIAGSFIQLLSDLPGYLEKLEGSLELVSPVLISIGIDPASLTFQNFIGSFSAVIGGLISDLWDIASPLVLILLTTLFLLFEAKGFSQKLQIIIAELCPGDMDRFTMLAQKNVDYIIIRTQVNLVMGIGTAAVLTLLGVKYAVFWGFLAFLLGFIPNIGILDRRCPAHAPCLVRSRARTGPAGSCRIRAYGHPCRIHSVSPPHRPGTGSLHCRCIYLAFFLGMDSWRDRRSPRGSPYTPCPDDL